MWIGKPNANSDASITISPNATVEDNVIIGGQIAGVGASDMVSELALAIESGMNGTTVTREWEFEGFCFKPCFFSFFDCHPYSSQFWISKRYSRHR
jgi:hypothetical protein